LKEAKEASARFAEQLAEVKETGKMKEYILEAHRGAAFDCPESTMAAFRAAHERGYGMIELDTKFTADNVCVILHDNTINRTARNSDGSALANDIRISSLTFEEARKYDYGIWMGEKFKGEKLVTLEEILTFAKEKEIQLKFDNVVQSHNADQRKIFFDTIEAADMPDGLVGFTANSFTYIEEVLGRFPDAYIHYDGPVNADTLERLGKLVDKEHLTVWLRYDNANTAWNKNKPVDAESSAMVKKYGKLGVWLLTKDEELVKAVNEFNADVVETDGSLRP